MIYGERIRLRAIERTDIPRFVKWFNDPEVITGLNIYRPISETDEEKWIDNMLISPPDERPFALEVRLENGEWLHIGNCGFMTIEWRVRSAELAIAIGDKEYWNKGYGSEAMCLLVEYAFNTLNLNRTHLRVFEYNQRAIRTYEKIGFVHEGRQRQGQYYQGRYYDVLMMSILRQEWENAGTA